MTLDATTASVNDQGAMLLCKRSLAVETQLQLSKNGRTQQKQLCRIVRAPIESADGYLVPVEFTSLAPGFWGISFPPPELESAFPRTARDARAFGRYSIAPSGAHTRYCVGSNR